MKSRWMSVVLAVAVATAGSACGSSSKEAEQSSTTPTTQKPKSGTVVLMAHDSFAASEPVLAAFTEETGYKVKVLKSGDAGAALGQAIVVKDHPVADAFFGVDNTFLTRALDNDIFEPFTSAGLANVPEKFQLDPEHRVTPIDTGNVCVIDDLEWFGKEGRPAAPKSLSDLTKPAYRNLLVVENPTSSSPGLAFLLTTIAAFGEKGWQGYWKDLRANGVRVVEGWEQAYNADFTASAKSGDRPLVVSYATDPAANVLFSEGTLTEPTVGVLSDTCFAQTEFAGVLRNAKNPDGARALINFMLTSRFQEDIPLQMYVYPVVSGTKLPVEFEKFAIPPTDPYELAPAAIGSKRSEWIDEWTQIVLR